MDERVSWLVVFDAPETRGALSCRASRSWLLRSRWKCAKTVWPRLARFEHPSDVFLTTPAPTPARVSADPAASRRPVPGRTRTPRAWTPPSWGGSPAPRESGNSREIEECARLRREGDTRHQLENNHRGSEKSDFKIQISIRLGARFPHRHRRHERNRRRRERFGGGTCW